LPEFISLFRLSLPALLLSAMPAVACPVDKAVDIEWNGSQFLGVVLDGPDAQGNCLVSYDDWDETWNEWVAPSRLANIPTPVAPAAATCTIGASRQIEWNGSMWAGTILDGPNAAGECYVTYDGWDATWDEWVGQDRLPAAEVAAPVLANCPVGETREIHWGSQWWAGSILEGPNTQGQCFVTYEGWDATWNEWVPTDRIRIAGSN
jgi:hypothetical protein